MAFIYMHNIHTCMLKHTKRGESQRQRDRDTYTERETEGLENTCMSPFMEVM